MGKYVCLILLVASLASLSSCRGGAGARLSLRLADSLMETRPDSSLAVLRRDSALFSSASLRLRMAYAVSRAEAEDKLYVPHRSDSAVLPAAEYFARYGSALESVRSWYVLGRVYSDMLLYGRALSAFDNAVSVEAEDDSAVCRYKARACTWAGAVYEEKGLHGDALRYNKKSYEYARCCDVPSVEVYSLRDIGRSYSDLSYNKTAIPYYRRAAEKAKALNDAYLYNMVMEELASVYMDEGMLDDARKALSAPFNSTLAEDLAPHYFVWADYYEKKGNIDSAIICNKKGMEYGGNESNMAVALDLVRLFEIADNHEEAKKYYGLYSIYKDSVEAERLTANNDLLGFVEKNITTERRNASLAEDKSRLVMLLLCLVLVVAAVVVWGLRFYGRRKLMYERQQERINRYWSKRHEADMSNIRKNYERISALERELSSAGERLTELQKKLIETEADMLGKRNEQILSEQRHKDALVAELESSEIYVKYHTSGLAYDNSDFLQLKDALNTAYDRFVFRLAELYPDVRYDEMYVCCLTKIRLASKEMCAVLDCRANKISMTKTRLYLKIFKKKGSVSDFDDFIRGF